MFPNLVKNDVTGQLSANEGLEWQMSAVTATSRKIADRLLSRIQERSDYRLRTLSEGSAEKGRNRGSRCLNFAKGN